MDCPSCGAGDTQTHDPLCGYADDEPKKAPTISPLRAIDIPATEDHSAIQEWFFTDDAMRESLAQRQAFAHRDGSVKDCNGKIIGLWYFAHFSSKYPSQIFDQVAEGADNSMDDDPNFRDQRVRRPSEEKFSGHGWED